jgi:hypothetical protein
MAALAGATAMNAATVAAEIQDKSLDMDFTLS